MLSACPTIDMRATGCMHHDCQIKNSELPRNTNLESAQGGTCRSSKAASIRARRRHGSIIYLVLGRSTDTRCHEKAGRLDSLFQRTAHCWAVIDAAEHRWLKKFGMKSSLTAAERRASGGEVMWCGRVWERELASCSFCCMMEVWKKR